MSEPVKTPDRKARAARTRLRILAAAYELCLEQGYADASMGRIAARAGVAVQTVHFVFHTKEELLAAVIDAAVIGLLPVGGEPEAPEESTWWHEAKTEADARRAIALFVDGCLLVLARSAEISVQAMLAAKASESLAELVAESEEHRIREYRTFAQSLSDRGMLRADVDVQRATDVLGALVGDECYLAFVVTRGWGAETYAEWLKAELPRMLLPSHVP